MRILFCSSNTPLSWAIRLLTWSKHSHVAILAPNNETVYEATSPRVHKTTLAALKKYETTIQAVDFHLARPEAAIAWLETQVGKPYDWTALLSFIVHRDWASPNKWFCSELAAMAWDKGGSPLFRRDAVFLISPGMLWLLQGKEVKL
jgi:uncharacterized protein YycO